MSVSLAGYEVLPWVKGAACLCCTVLVVGVLTSIQAAPHCCATLLALCTPAKLGGPDAACSYILHDTAA